MKTGEHSEEMENWRRKIFESFNLKIEVCQYFFSIKGKFWKKRKFLMTASNNFMNLRTNSRNRHAKWRLYLMGFSDDSNLNCKVSLLRGQVPVLEKAISSGICKGVFEKLHRE